MMPEIEKKLHVPSGVYGRFDLFIDTFLLPEAIAVILSKEYQCTLHEGFQMAWLSEPMGVMEHPSEGDCPYLKRVQEATDIVDLRRQYEMGEVAFLKGSAKQSGPTYVHLLFGDAS